MKQKIYALRSWVTLLLLGLVSVAWGQTEEVIYETGFEASDGFKASTTYNNSAEVLTGADGQQWATVCGTPSTTSPLTGSASMQMRYYKSVKKAPYTLMAFSLPNVTKVEFSAKSTDKNNVLVQHSTDGGSTWSEGETFILSTSKETFVYNVVGDNASVRIKFTTVLPASPTDKSRLYIDDVKVYGIQTGVETVATPIFTPATGTTFENDLQVTLTSATEGATIYYTKDGSEPTTDAEEYTAPFTITETTTVKAIAVKEGMENSGVVTAIYNKVEMLNGIAALKEIITSETEVNYVCRLTNAVVTAVTNSNVYIQDDEAAIMLFMYDHGFVAGQRIDGIVKGTAKVYNGLRELLSMDHSAATLTDGAEQPVKTVTLAELTANFDAYESMRVQVVDATVTKAFANKNAAISQNGAEIVLRAASTDITAVEGTTVDVTGYPGLFNTTQQLNVLVQENIVVKGGKEVATLAFPADAYSLNIGEKQTVTATTNSTATIEYASSNESIATVDAVSGEVTAVAAGKVTITARVAENDEYTAAEASYALTVVDPDAKVEGTALVAPLEGAYYAMLTKAGTTKNTIAAKAVNVVNDKVVLTGDLTIDDLAWVINEAKGTIRTNTGEYLTAASGSTNLNLSTAETTWTYEEGMWKLGTRSFIYTTSGYFKNYAISNIGKASYADGATVAMPITSGYVRTVTAENFGTICLPNDVAAADFGGAEFYTVAGKRTEGGALKSVVLVEATELKAGVPYIFRATSDKLVAAYSGQAVTAAASENGLQGTLTDVNAAHDTEDTTLEGMYMLTGNKLQLCGKGCWLGANRAYIDMNAVPEADASVKGLEIGLDGLLTGIAGVEADAETAAATTDVYTVSGVRVRSKVSAASATDGLRPGIYLVNGKKVIVK